VDGKKSEERWDASLVGTNLVTGESGQKPVTSLSLRASLEQEVENGLRNIGRLATLALDRNSMYEVDGLLNTIVAETALASSRLKTLKLITLSPLSQLKDSRRGTM
jgi:hypothetical protein